VGSCFLYSLCRGYVTEARCHHKVVLRRQLGKEEVGVGRSSACEDVSLGTEVCPPLKDIKAEH
jgi:hypothetical protein